MSTTPEPDYYRILNVHHQADPEIIESAYRQMRDKYRGAAAAERDIDAAYATLIDPDQRAAYDARRRASMRPAPLAPAPEKKVAPKPAAAAPMAAPPPIPEAGLGEERHKIQAKCSLTGQGFDMVLQRTKGPTPRYRVIGFEPWPSRPSDPQPRKGFFDRMLKLVGISGDESHAPVRDPSKARGADVDDEYLEFEQLDFAMQRCPMCDGGAKNSATWAICGRCHQILCMGALDGDLRSSSIRCPWCGTTLRFGGQPGSGGRVKATSRPPMIDPKPGNPMLPPSSKKGLPGR